MWANKLSGPVPVELARLVELRSLELDLNQLTGPVPPQLGNLRNLRELWLWGNKLSGPIPPELGLLTELRQLVLDSNELTGEIPRELTNLTGLLALYLARNDLTGCVPPELRAVHVNDLDMLEIPFCDLVLSSLSVSPGALEPPFDPYRARYSVTVDAPQITITAASAHNAAFRFFAGPQAPIPDADPETGGHQVDLAPGLNRIFLEVTSQDGEGTDYYLINVVYAVGAGPSFPADRFERSVVENTPPGEPVGEPVTAEDPDGDLLFYALGGPDARFFRVDDAGQISVGPGTVLDYETRATYEVQVIAADGNGNSAAADVTITVTDVDLGTPYDRDSNEVIDREEAVAAVVDFIGGLITKEEAVAVVVLYLTGGQGQQAATPAGIPASPGTTKGAADAPAKGKRPARRTSRGRTTASCRGT